MAKTISITNFGSQKINYKKALAVFLLGQMTVSGAWGVTNIVADTIVDGSVTHANITDSAHFTADNTTLTVGNGGIVDNSTGGVAAVTADAGIPALGDNITIEVNEGGLIQGTEAIKINDPGSAGTVIIDNKGTIEATAGAPNNNAIHLGASNAVLNLNNIGIIKGDIVTSVNVGGEITNEGVIKGGITAGNGDDTITISGGQITGTINGYAGNNELKVQGNFTTENTIENMQTIKVTNPGITFTVDHAITEVETDLNTAEGTTITVGAGGSINFAAGGGATITNAGTLKVEAGGTMGDTAAAGDLTNADTGNIDIQASVAGAFKAANVTNNGNISINVSGVAANAIVFNDINNNANATINIVNDSATAGAITFNDILGNNGTISINNKHGANAIVIHDVPAGNNGVLNITGPLKITAQSANLSNTGTVNFDNDAELDIGATHNFDNNKGVNFNNATKITAHVFNNNGQVIAKAPVTIDGDYMMGAAAKHTMHIASGTSSTLTAANVDFGSTADQTLEIITEGNTFLTNGQTITVATGTAAVLNAANVNLVDPSATLKYVLSATATDILVTATRTPYSSLVSSGNESAVATVINSIINSGATLDPDMKQILAYIDQLPDTQSVASAMSQLTPDISAGQGASPSFEAAALALDAMGDRLASLRFGIDTTRNFYSLADAKKAKSGYAAGGMTSNRNAWIKGFGASNKQTKREESLGYNANTGGFAFGMDHQLKNDSWIGIGLSYANTHVKTRDFPADRTKVDSYQATVYGTHSLGKYYLDGFLALAHNKYKTAKNIVFGPLNRTATAKFTGLQPSGKVAGGYVHSYGNFKIIPNASLQYTSLKQKQYDEIGAQAVNLKNVSSKSVQQLEGGIGLKLAVFHKDNNKTIIPDVHAMALYDFVSTRQESISEFEGGGGRFTVKGAKPDKTTYNIGAGLTYIHKDKLHFTFNYDLRSKKQFTGHSGSLAVKYMI